VRVLLRTRTDWEEADALVWSASDTRKLLRVRSYERTSSLVHYGADLTLNASETSGQTGSTLGPESRVQVQYPWAAMMVYEARDIASVAITSSVEQEREGHDLINSCRSQAVHVS
jgi:hypothetical protein